MNVETFNYSLESLAPFFYLNKRNRKNIYIFPTEKEARYEPQDENQRTRRKIHGECDVRSGPARRHTCLACWRRA